MAARKNSARGKRIQQLREQRELTVAQVAERLSLTVQSIYQWEKGGQIKPKNVDKLAELFQVPSSYIYDGGDAGGVRFVDSDRPRRVPKISLDDIKGCEFTLVMEQVRETQEYIVSHFPTGGTSFAFELIDDSNQPDYREGDVIVVDPDLAPRPGEYVLASVNGSEYVFRRYRLHGNGFSLVPGNPDWPTLHSESHDIQVVAVMTEFSRRAR